eukprot:scaffold603_cov404-Prasinococcus_capsulatus_cf.AAC.17
MSPTAPLNQRAPWLLWYEPRCTRAARADASITTDLLLVKGSSALDPAISPSLRILLVSRKLVRVEDRGQLGRSKVPRGFSPEVRSGR